MAKNKVNAVAERNALAKALLAYIASEDGKRHLVYKNGSGDYRFNPDKLAEKFSPLPRFDAVGREIKPENPGGELLKVLRDVKDIFAAKANAATDPATKSQWVEKFDKMDGLLGMFRRQSGRVSGEVQDIDNELLAEFDSIDVGGDLTEGL